MLFEILIRVIWNVILFSIYGTKDKLWKENDRLGKEILPWEEVEWRKNTLNKVLEDCHGEVSMKGEDWNVLEERFLLKKSS